LWGAHLKSQIRRKKVSNRSAVFGGAGFIGTNLVYQLIEDGQQVFNFDNLSGLGNLLNIAELMQQSNHSFARCDVTNSEEIRQSLLMAAPDTIFFCITPKKLDSSNALEPFECFLKTLKNWRETFADRVLPVSKIVIVISEFHKSQKQLKKVYDDIKAVIDQYVAEGLPVTSLFVPIAFGPFQQPDSPIPLIIYRAIEGETIPVMYPEEPAGDLVYVKDVAEACLLVEDRGQIGVHYEMEGTQPSFTNIEAADCICSVLNKYLPPPVGRYQALIEEIAADTPPAPEIPKNEASLDRLGHLTKTPLSEGLSATVKWYLDNDRWYSQSKTRFFYLWQNPENVLSS